MPGGWCVAGLAGRRGRCYAAARGAKHQQGGDVRCDTDTRVLAATEGARKCS